MTYNLNFYRGCVGPAGCDDGCIAMATDYPFTVTIQGKTVEHTNKVVKSIIKDSVCQSAAVIFSKKTSKGVAPYGTTVWSLDRSGSPVLGLGDSITKSFLNPGTYWIYAKTIDVCNNFALDSQKIYVDSVWAPNSTDTINYCLGLPSVSLTASKDSQLIPYFGIRLPLEVLLVWLLLFLQLRLQE